MNFPNTLTNSIVGVFAYRNPAMSIRPTSYRVIFLGKPLTDYEHEILDILETTTLRDAMKNSFAHGATYGEKELCDVRFEAILDHGKGMMAMPREMGDRVMKKLPYWRSRYDHEIAESLIARTLSLQPYNDNFPVYA